jgi:hypothetical protein
VAHVVGGRMTPREQTVARYGSHWYAGHGIDADVSERLGNKDAEDPEGSSLERALDWAREHRMTAIARVAAHAAHILSSNRLTVALSRIGLHPRSAEMMEHVRKHDADVERGRIALLDHATWAPKRNPLPASMRLPAPIPVGAQLWEVGWEWPMRHGIRLRKLVVSGVRVYEGCERSIWDSVVIYNTKRVDSDRSTPSSEPSFTYDREDFEDPQVDLQSNGDSAVYLTREAAVSCMNRVALVLDHRASEARAVCATTA